MPMRKGKESPVRGEKRVSQWEEIMRKFSQAHEEECKSVPLNIPRAHRSAKFFPTGSQYEGTWDVLGMSGFGVYTFPNGVVYEGDFEDGMFHGLGQIRYKNGTTISGHFNRGVMMDRKLTFSDGLEYDEHDWQYCRMPDRRYTAEYEHGLAPAGISNITARMPPRAIPPGFYDTGDGFFDPATKSVYKANDLSTILRSPSMREQQWIIENCRTNPEPVMGPCRFLYEEWQEPQVTLPEVPEPAASTRPKLSTIHQTVIDRENSIFRKRTFSKASGILKTRDHLTQSQLDDARASVCTSYEDKYEKLRALKSCNVNEPENIEDKRLSNPQSYADDDLDYENVFNNPINMYDYKSMGSNTKVPSENKINNDETVSPNPSFSQSLIVYENPDDPKESVSSHSSSAFLFYTPSWQARLNELFKQNQIFVEKIEALLSQQISS